MYTYAKMQKAITNGNGEEGRNIFCPVCRYVHICLSRLDNMVLRKEKQFKYVNKLKFFVSRADIKNVDVVLKYMKTL